VRFIITMNMPSSSGNLVHQMHVTHSSLTLESFINELSKNDFLIVEEFYKKETGYESRGPIAISYRNVGKIKMINGGN
jgi:hypothetical protein